MRIFLAHIFRGLGAFTTFNTARETNKKRIILSNSLSNILISIQYILLGAITGGIVNILTLVRNLFIHKFGKKIPLSIMLFYFLILLIISYNSINNFMDFIPLILIIIYSLGLYTDDSLKIKYATILVCLLELPYDYYYKAYVGLFACIIEIGIAYSSLIQIRNNKKVEL